MGERFFVASCVFTEGEPELSRKVQAYVKDRLPLLHSWLEPGRQAGDSSCKAAV